jgi:hypothetical protein
VFPVERLTRSDFTGPASETLIEPLGPP